ncbi:MAG: hypothetical protein QM759_16915 [Terricaulis sp.]
MVSSIVVLANDSHAEPVADRVSADLAKLGFKVDRATPGRATAAKIEAAHRVIVLWSRAARGTPALRAAVQRARAKGTLVCVGLHAAPPLVGVKRVARVPQSGSAWRSALAKRRAVAVAANRIARTRTPPKRARRTAKAGGDKTMNAVATPAPATRKAPILGFLATVLVFGAAVGTGMYQTDAAFAAKVNTLARDAQVQVAALTGKH